MFTTQLQHMLSTRRLVLAALLMAAVGAAAAPAAGQTLADVARQEAVRRKTIKKPAKLYTNASLHAAPPTEAESPGAVPPAQPVQPAPAKPAASAPAAAPEAASPGPVKDEAYWRRRITEARAQRDRNQVYLDSLQNRIDGLWADFTARDDPAQRSVIGQNRDRAIAELERLKKEQESLEKQIVAIEEEARQAGVPPGWLR